MKNLFYSVAFIFLFINAANCQPRSFNRFEIMTNPFQIRDKIPNVEIGMYPFKWLSLNTSANLIEDNFETANGEHTIRGYNLNAELRVFPFGSPRNIRLYARKYSRTWFVKNAKPHFTSSCPIFKRPAFIKLNQLLQGFYLAPGLEYQQSKLSSTVRYEELEASSINKITRKGISLRLGYALQIENISLGASYGIAGYKFDIKGDDSELFDHYNSGGKYIPFPIQPRLEIKAGLNF